MIVRLASDTALGPGLGSCVHRLGKRGGVCDARALAGFHEVEEDPLGRAEGPVTVLLGDVTVVLHVGLRLRSGAVLRGTPGKTRLVAKTQSAAYLLRVVDDADVVIADLDVDGRRTETPFRTVLIYLQGAERVRIERNRLRNARLQAVMITAGNRPAADNAVVDNDIDGYGTEQTGDGVALFRGTQRTVVRGNRIRNGGPNTDAILVDDATASSTESLPSNDNLIEGNVLEDVWYGVIVEGSKGTRIRNNRIHRARATGVLVQAGNGSGFSVSPRQTVILGNTFARVAGLAAISVNGQGILIQRNTIERSQNGARGIVLHAEGDAAPSASITICENLVTSLEGGASLRIGPQHANNVVVSRNHLRGGAEPSIVATGSGRGWVFTENLIEGASGSGILVEGAVDDLAIVGNVLLRPAATVQAPGIVVAVGKRPVGIENNTVHDPLGVWQPPLALGFQTFARQPFRNTFGLST